MTRVILQPPKVIIIHDLLEMTQQRFFEWLAEASVSAQSHIEPRCAGSDDFAWILDKAEAEDSDGVFKELLRGRLHINVLYYCELENPIESYTVTYRTQEFTTRINREYSLEHKAIERFLQRIKTKQAKVVEPVSAPFLSR
jgi:hypothetical protein